MKLIYKIIFILLCPAWLWASEQHPRVSELEDKYKKDANNYLEARFPGLPFSVHVSIDPLRRISADSYALKGEVLPFYALDEENIKDEWDDPTASLYTLSNRVKKIFVTVQVPESLKQDELDEVKMTLTQILRLLPARDQIEVTRRQWTVFPHFKMYATWGGLGILLFLGGLFVIFFASTRKVSNSLENVQAYLKNSGNISSSGGSSSVSKTNREPTKAPNDFSNDLRFNDPIKMREVIQDRLGSLVKMHDLIRLENLQLLDEVGKKSPETLGAVMTLLPIELQKEIFSMSRGSHWLEAFTSPGELNYKCLELIEKLGKVKPSHFSENWEKLLIQIWRMDNGGTNLLKSLPQEKAMALLGAMPKYISLPIARSAFPGSWAVLLDPNYKYKEITETECKELYDKTLYYKPLETFDKIEAYKRYIELLKYVETADIRTEKEIYEACSHDSLIFLLRAPFYLLFEQSKELLEYMFKQFEINDWAVALFNVPREVRYSIESLFSPKEKFYYTELLQSLDRNPPTEEEVKRVRNLIAQALQSHLQENKVTEDNEDTTKVTQDESDSGVAA